jgi:hypothetical protein
MGRTIFSLFLTFFVGKKNGVLSAQSLEGQRSGLGKKRSEPARGGRLQVADLHDAPDKTDSLGHNVQYDFYT